MGECVLNESDNFKCYNGGQCLQIELNATSSAKVCNCKPGFTGRQCAQRTMPCSPDPCGPNGYCNSLVSSSFSDNINNNEGMGYFCRCKPGFAGLNCQENINDCLNATCHNGGSCVDAINSYTCDCPWPFMGRYCQSRMRCADAASVCQNNGTCVEAAKGTDGAPRCLCSPGYTGVDCSTRVDPCASHPCVNNGRCAWLRADNDFECECAHGFTGKMCQLVDVCASGEAEMPCENNSTCIDLMRRSATNRRPSEQLETASFYCQCLPRFTGIRCDVKVWCSGNSSQESGKS